MNDLVIKFIRLTAGSDPANHIKTEIVLDTNVAGEIYTLGDLFKTVDQLGIEAALQSSHLRYRQRRAKNSIILAWWLAKDRIPTGVLGAEGIDIITGKLAPETHAASYAMATA